MLCKHSPVSARHTRALLSSAPLAIRPSAVAATE
jgi:hypothetical protein